MCRFLAVLSSPHDRLSPYPLADFLRELQTVSGHWEHVFTSDGIAVFYSGVHPPTLQAYVLPDQNGVVLGKLFHCPAQLEPTASPCLTFDPRAADLIISTEGRHLLQSFWGRYVAFFRDSGRDIGFVIRDPSGQIPCYSICIDGFHLFFSHLRDIPSSMRRNLSLNPRFLAAQFLEIELCNGQTGLHQVDEVLAGECYSLRNGHIAKTFHWRPSAICKSRRVEGYSDATTALRHTTQYCVGAWAHTYQVLVHELSGGLDSSIVLSCLRTCLPSESITCVNYFTEASLGDEREYARLAASQADTELIEFPLPASTDLEPLISDVEITSKPDWSIFNSIGRSLERPIAIARRARAITSGQGGDHLFCHAPLPTVAADLALTHPPSFPVLTHLVNIARLTQESFWTILRTALIRGWLRYDRRPTAPLRIRAPSFVTPDAIQSTDDGYLSHPWQLDVNGIAPGKRLQIVDICKLLHRFPSIDSCGDAHIIHPLMSQPLLELCLAIPTYVLIDYGRQSRAAARDAFRSAIPAGIAQRQAKGLTSSYFARICETNLTLVKALALDGLLGKQPWIDRRKLSAIVSRDSLVDPEDTLSLLQFIATEIWLQRLSAFMSLP